MATYCDMMAIKATMATHTIMLLMNQTCVEVAYVEILVMDDKFMTVSNKLLIVYTHLCYIIKLIMLF